MRVINTILIVLIGVCSTTHNAFAATIGSETTVTKQGFFTFPAKDTDNNIRGFASMSEGFSLESMLTTCSFDATFPISRRMHLNGGTLLLLRDIGLENMTTFTSLGTILANEYIFDLPNGLDTLGATGVRGIFDNIKFCLNSNIHLFSSLYFRGTSLLHGNGNTLDLGQAGEIIVAANSKLVIKNIRIESVHGNNIRCEDDSARIILNNVEWVFDGQYTFTRGAFTWLNVVTLLGSQAFAYQSQMTSTVGPNSRLILDNGITFSYDPILSSASNLIEFVDRSSQLILDDATLHATTTGMSLQKGKLIIEGISAISSEVDPFGTLRTVAFGNDDATTDMILLIRPGAELVIAGGALDYRNVSAGSLVMQSLLSTIRVLSGANLRVYETMNLGVGQAIFEDGGILSLASGKDIVGPLVPRGTFIRTIAT